MKLLHLSDLHIGKKVHGHDLSEEQKDILSQVIAYAKDQKADAILISGDVYDTSMPGVEAVDLLDWFWTQLAALDIPVFVISGNHDSATRLGFGKELMKNARFYVATGFDGTVGHWDLEEGDLKVRIHLLPFVKPGVVRAALDADCTGWTEAVGLALDQAELLEDGKNILLSHQFYAGGQTCESEQLHVGGLDVVDCSVLDPFDYAALGHLHQPQSVKDSKNRYCGTLLKFSTSEIGTNKTVTMVDVSKEGIHIEELPLKPLHDFKKIQGTFNELVSRDFYENLDRDDYFYIVLDDEQEVYDGMLKLASVYPKILRMEYANKPQLQTQTQITTTDAKTLSPADLVAQFYASQRGTELDEERKALVTSLWEEIHETH